MEPKNNLSEQVRNAKDAQAKFGKAEVGTQEVLDRLTSEVQLNEKLYLLKAGERLSALTVGELVRLGFGVTETTDFLGVPRVYITW